MVPRAALARETQRLVGQELVAQRVAGGDESDAIREMLGLCQSRRPVYRFHIPNDEACLKSIVSMPLLL
jgi:hypothetical protein